MSLRTERLLLGTIAAIGIFAAFALGLLVGFGITRILP